MKVAEFDRVETILFREQTPADGAPENIKRVGRDGEERFAALCAKGAHILKSLQAGSFLTAYIKKDNIRPFDPHLGGRDE